MDKIDFAKSIEDMEENFDFKVRRFPRYTFGDKDRCKKILQAAILKSDETVEKLEWLPEYDEVSEWLSDTKGKGLLLAGDVGRGKTNIVLHAVPLIFYHFQKKVVKCTHSNDLHKNLKEFANKLLIAVDEVGTEPIMNNYGEKTEPINVLFDLAESNCKILLLSTNFNSEQIQERYGVRTLDRITRLCKIVKFEGESMRK